MVELAGRSLLEWQLRSLRAAGVSDMTIVAGYRSEGITARGCRLLRNPDYATTNMVATLFCARRLFTPERDLLVSYGDIVYEPGVLAALRRCRAPLCVAVDTAWRRYWEARMPDPLADAETLRLGPGGNILELGKTPRRYDDIEAQYIGLFKVRADRLRHLLAAYDAMDRRAQFDGTSFDTMYMTSFLQHLIDAGWTVRAVPIRNGWLEVDSPDDLKRYERMYADGVLDRFCRLPRQGPRVEGTVA